MLHCTGINIPRHLLRGDMNFTFEQIEYLERTLIMKDLRITCVGDDIFGDVLGDVKGDVWGGVLGDVGGGDTGGDTGGVVVGDVSWPVWGGEG